MSVQLLNTIYTLTTVLLILFLGVNTLLAFWPLKGKSSYFSQEMKQNKNNAVVKVSGFLWRKKYRQLIAGATLLLALVVSWLDNFFGLNIEAKDELSSILLVVTAGIVFWSMRETFDLKVIQQRQETIQLKQFEFENRPYIRVAWPNKGDEILHISNQGKGLARDIFIEAVRVDKGDNPRLVFKPQGRAIIAPGETAIVTVDEIQGAAGLAEVNEYAEYVTRIKPEMNERLKEGAIEKIHLSYIDLGENIYDAFFVPREDVQGRFIVDSQEKRS